ncbi:MAG: aminotransferase class I/II-fold pyridoxal phosphate-dependent enzyme [Gammaproteobacteria bacterium]|nr:aminotransferase class I/II-fold pyridoxal phosphate-dependent enzyme [Gammaproteobacteria bacterium]
MTTKTAEPAMTQSSTVSFDSAAAILDLLKSKISALSRLPIDRIENNTPLIDIGLNSIAIVELNFFIKDKIGIELPVSSLTEETTANDLADELFETMQQTEVEQPAKPAMAEIDTKKLSESHYNIEKLPAYYQVDMQKKVMERASIATPYFRPHEGVASATTQVDGKQYINFACYNYLDLCGQQKVSDAAKKAIDQYGTSASSSRIVSGERPIQRDLETKLAEFYQVDDALVFVSGHATNVTTIGHLFDSNDLIVYDELCHNSALQGAKLSGARSLSFKHNDMKDLERLLEQNRMDYKRTLILTEGLYSMEGDTPPLQQMVDLKKHYRAFLMVDEAHATGVLGKTGQGIAEHLGVDTRDVDIWMGTLSKTLSSCGGYIAGSHKLIEYLRYTAPGFLYSVGLSPPLAAASLAALELMLAEPERVQQLQENSRLMFDLLRAEGFDLSTCEGHAVIPVVIGRSIFTISLANKLFENGINVQPIIYPAVSENKARLRFFMCSVHTREQIEKTAKCLKACYDELKPQYS